MLSIFKVVLTNTLFIISQKQLSISLPAKTQVLQIPHPWTNQKLVSNFACLCLYIAWKLLFFYNISYIISSHISEYQYIGPVIKMGQ